MHILTCMHTCVHTHTHTCMHAYMDCSVDKPSHVFISPTLSTDLKWCPFIYSFKPHFKNALLFYKSENTVDNNSTLKEIQI